MKKRKVQIKRERNEAKRERRDEREKLRSELGEDAPPKQEPKTLENTREEDETYVEPNDQEILLEDATDAMANYFAHDTKPKVLITTSPGAKVKTWKLCFELKKCVPNSEIFSRKNVALKKIVKQAIEKQFTDLVVIHEVFKGKVNLVVIHEDYKKPNGLILSHLPDGPTAYFKINTLEYTKQIKGAGVSTSHLPEVILNNFKTRLGHTIGRMLACLFPHTPQYTGRRAVTFHNQRDYIFFRHHRYEFKENGERAALHELGPRFTLRLKWLQKGTYDTREGEYEWTLKRHEMETSRRRFFL
ncbi:brix domain-containing protein [Ditylenchus destructor]|nr:brix domain-containing protein [Ditylenchus destructor]